MRKNYNYRTIKRYIREIKALLPLMRKDEKRYLNNMKQNLEDYCFDRKDITINALYEEFGEPHEIVYNYYLSIDTSAFLAKVRVRRRVTIFLCFIFLTVFLFLTYYSYILHEEHKMFMRQEVVFIEDVITD